MKCPHCGKSVDPQKAVDPAQVAKDLLEGFGNGLTGKSLLDFAQRSLPKSDGDRSKSSTTVKD